MSAFLKDDFEQLRRLYFEDLWIRGSCKTDPSGWVDTELLSKDLLPHSIQKVYGIERYYIDEWNDLAGIKESFVDFASAWDSYPYSFHNLTLCSSVTVGLAIVLSALKRKGIKTILVETPAYFAGLSQAIDFGLNVVLLPTYFQDGFELTGLKRSISKVVKPLALLISQPRTYLGINQKPATLAGHLRFLSRDDFLVIDEALEQDWPSTLNWISSSDHNVIRVRSFTKGIGLNGLRLGCILHDESLRGDIISSMENFQGGLNIQSMLMTRELIKDVSLFKRLLAAANKRVLDLKRRADMEVLGSCLVLSEIRNGYLGSVALPRPLALSKKVNWRKRIISQCVRFRCPVVLGSSMYFARDRRHEFIRLTYFNAEMQILNGLKIFRSICEDL